MAQKVTNTTFSYTHQNFNGQTIDVSLNDVATDEGTLTLDVKAPNNRNGSAQIQMQDSGEVIIRVHRNADNPIRVLIVGDEGTLFEG